MSSSFKISDDEVINNIVEKFPITAAAAKGINETDRKDRLFVPYLDGELTMLPIPKNAGNLSENLLFISILKIAQLKNWKIIKAATEVPAEVFANDKVSFFAGYVSKSYDNFVGKRIKAHNAYERGMLSAQTAAVLAAVGNKNAHIRRCEHSPGKILAEMKGFVKEYWGLRGSISSLFNQLPKPKLADDELFTYMLQGGELIGKIVRKHLPYSNGGVFRKCELNYLNNRYTQAQLYIEKVHSWCKNPTEDFARNFQGHLDKLTEYCKDIDAEIGALRAERAKYLFKSPTSKKRSDIQWNKLPLEDKLIQTTPERLSDLFSPCGIPGFHKAKKTAPKDFDGDVLAYTWGCISTDKEKEGLMEAIALAFEGLLEDASASA